MGGGGGPGGEGALRLREVERGGSDLGGLACYLTNSQHSGLRANASARLAPPDLVPKVPESGAAADLDSFMRKRKHIEVLVAVNDKL